MPRPYKTDRPVKVGVYVPQSILDRVDAELFSDVEGKVPFGKKSDLITDLLVDWLRYRGAID